MCWGYLLSIAIGLVDILTSLIVGADPASFTRSLFRRWFDICAIIFVLSCFAELLIYAGWLLMRQFKCDSQIYPHPVLIVHVEATADYLCLGLVKLRSPNNTYV